MKTLSLNVVLVRSLYESNIGATARAMTNMGAQQLYLVQPQCEIGLKAHQSAASGQKPLEQLKVIESLKDLVAAHPQSLWVGLSAKDGRGRLAIPLEEIVDQAAQRMEEETSTSLEVFLVFGPEDWGLSNEDLEPVHFVGRLPTFGEVTSLNLAQAVLLTLFIFRNSGNFQTPITTLTVNEKKATSEFPDQALEEWLIQLGLDVSSPRMNALTSMRRFLKRQWPTEKELGVFNMVIQQSLRKMREYNELREKLNLPLPSSIKKETKNDSDPSFGI